jgi:DNA-binding XRE family transcriptional regulator
MDNGRVRSERRATSLIRRDGSSGACSSQAPHLAARAEVRRMAETGLCRAVREMADATLEEIGTEVGVSSSAISRWERGLRLPRGRRAGRYLEVLRALQEMGGGAS